NRGAGIWGDYHMRKIRCEEMLVEATAARGLRWSVIRPSIVLGPYQHIADREPKLFARLLAGRPILVPGSGENFFHPGDVEEIAALVLAILDHDTAVGRAYNCSMRDAVTLNHFVSTLAEAAGVAPQVVHLPTEWARARGIPVSVFPFRWERSVV